MKSNLNTTQRGVSLVELMAVLVIVGTLFGAALPAFESARARHHLEGAAAQLRTELQYARSSAEIGRASCRERV